MVLATRKVRCPPCSRKRARCALLRSSHPLRCPPWRHADQAGTGKQASQPNWKAPTCCAARQAVFGRTMALRLVKTHRMHATEAATGCEFRRNQAVSIPNRPGFRMVWKLGSCPCGILSRAGFDRRLRRIMAMAVGSE
jgi:hypothetical protein